MEDDDIINNDEFLQIVVLHLKNQLSCEIIDETTFKSLMHTFYYVSMKERSTIIKKI
jgi:hypothetical protein